MIDKNHKIMDMLANILDKVNAIYFNMQEDGKTHYSYMLEKLGYKNVSPAYNDERTDIIQTLELGSKENLVSFTQGIQSTSPIDSFVRVMAAPMPGYPFDEVMAAGSFTQGSTIELSADAPVVEPYTLYMQGGLTLEYGKLSILLALTNMKNN